MSQHWVFYDQPGSIPGIPNTFSNCLVDVHDDGTVEVRPLVSAVQVIEASAEILPLKQGTPTEPLVEASTEASQPPEEAEAHAVVQEQEAPQLALNIN